MNEKILYTFIGAAIAGIICFSIAISKQGEKVVVVDVQKVLEEYQGFKEAKDSYELKIRDLTEGFNSKRKAFETETNKHKIFQNKLSESEKSKQENNLAKMEQELMNLGAKIEDQSAKEEERLLTGVYHKINDFINRYGKLKGYNAILGANGQGNVMFANDQTDITQEIIEALNEEYVNGI